MGEIKIEHVLLFLVGAFLVYHMMGKCGRVEGIQNCSDCKGPFSGGRCLMPGGICTHALGGKHCNYKGGTWCPDHVDTIPGQAGPPETQPGFIPGQTGPKRRPMTDFVTCVDMVNSDYISGRISAIQFADSLRTCEEDYK